eukprot:gene7293-5135_t
MSTLSILYGTQTGTAEGLALRLARYALLGGCDSVQVRAADEVPLSEWVSLSPMLLVCANANQGEAPLSIRQTWRALLDPGAPFLTGLFFAVFGMGDSLYEKFNYMAKMLHNRLHQLGGTPLVHRGLGDESDPKGIEEALEPFVRELWTVLGWARGLEPAHLPLHHFAASALPLFPLYQVECVSKDGGEAMDACAAQMVRNPSHFFCDVVSNRRLTAPGHFQAVHHVELRGSSGLPDIQVGDALGVFVKNARPQVDRALDLLRCTGDEIVVVQPYCPTDGSPCLRAQPRRDVFNAGDLPLRRLLEDFVDLEAVVSQEFLWMLSRLVDSDGSEEAAEVRERLLELSDPSRPAEYLAYAHREKRNVVEVLSDFKQLRVSLDLFVSFAPRMRARFFSIASSPQLDGPEACHLTVAQLRWTTPMNRERSGLCSTALTASVPGSRFECCHWDGGLVLPQIPLPLIAIATGTGIAPVRALLREWSAKAAASPDFAATPVYLFFGCRYAQRDYIYQEEWEQLRATTLPNLHIIPAFSRDGQAKVYVQHQLGRHAKAVGSLLGNKGCPPVVYVCGNAKQMPRDVSRALQQIATAVCADGDEAAGAALLQTMHNEGRYQVDTWSS